MEEEIKEEWKAIVDAWEELRRLGEELKEISSHLSGYQQNELDAVRRDIEEFKKQRAQREELENRPFLKKLFG